LLDPVLKIVARATRRPELRKAALGKARPLRLEPLIPFRPASRRTAQAGRLCYQTRVFKHVLMGEKCFLPDSWWPGGVGIEVENRHADRVRHLRAKERFFASLVAGVTALDGLAVLRFEFRRVFVRNC